MMERRKPFTERQDPQASIPFPLQAPHTKRESERTYAAVRTLRAAGHQVIRVGLYDHKVDGVLLSRARLLWIAAKVAPKVAP